MWSSTNAKSFNSDYLSNNKVMANEIFTHVFETDIPWRLNDATGCGL